MGWIDTVREYMGRDRSARMSRRDSRSPEELLGETVAFTDLSGQFDGPGSGPYTLTDLGTIHPSGDAGAHFYNLGVGKEDGPHDVLKRPGNVFDGESGMVVVAAPRSWWRDPKAVRSRGRP
jgi:hypothetical protein